MQSAHATIDNSAFVGNVAVSGMLLRPNACRMHVKEKGGMTDEENRSEYLLQPLRVIDCIAESSCVRGFVVDGGGCAAAMAMCVR